MQPDGEGLVFWNQIKCSWKGNFKAKCFDGEGLFKIPDGRIFYVRFPENTLWNDHIAFMFVERELERLYGRFKKNKKETFFFNYSFSEKALYPRPEILTSVPSST